MRDLHVDLCTMSTPDVQERCTDLIARNGALFVTEPVVMEVLAGARTEAREQDLRRLASHE